MGNPSNLVSKRSPTIPITQSIYAVDTTQQAPLGTRLEVGDRTFYYSNCAASQARGTVLCAANPVASHNGALATLSATNTEASSVTVTLGTTAGANLYAEGYMGISKGTQGGAVYRVKSHPAVAQNGTGSFTLYDALYKDVGANDEVGLVQNLYGNLILGSSALAVPVCVPLVDVTSAGYFWGQTYGPAAPLNQAATPASVSVKVGTTGGVLQAFNGGTTGPAAETTVIGKNYNLAGTAGEYTPIFLTIRD